MGLDLKNRLKKGFGAVVKAYKTVDQAVEDKKNQAINALEDKLATIGRKKKEEAKQAAASNDAPEAPPKSPGPATPDP